MKLLQICAQGDYDALAFEDTYRGTKVSDLIAEVEKGVVLQSDEEGELTELYSKVYEVGTVDPLFLSFVRNEVMDEDMCKHSNFYLETEIV